MRVKRHFVVAIDIGSHLDLLWAEPDYSRELTRLADRARVVIFERRGMGLSDPLDYLPSLEEQAQDIEAVYAAAGIERATLTGFVTTCQPVALFAARHPERVHGLVLVHPFSSRAEGLEEFDRVWEEVVSRWGQGRLLEAFSPGLISPANTRITALLERVSASPGTARWYTELVRHTDLSDVLRLIQAPTIVLGIPDHPYPARFVQDSARLIPGATYRELPQARPDMSIFEYLRPMIDAAYEAGGVAPQRVRRDRRLAAILFTDIVGSTELAASLGDEAWRERVRRHDAALAQAVTEHEGRVLKHTGDGALCLFDQPAAALACATSVPARLRVLDLEIRSGIHCGECEFVDGDVRGLAVHIAARVAALSTAGEVLVSRTVRDLVAGSGTSFDTRGEHQLKGVPGSWELFAVGDTATHQADLIDGAPRPRRSDRAVLLAARRAPRLLRTLNRVTRMSAS